MARALVTVSSVMKKGKGKYTVLSGNELKNLLLKGCAEAVREEADELFRKGSGKLKHNEDSRVLINRTRTKSKFSTVTSNRKVNGMSYESLAPDVKQKYKVLGTMFYRIVCRTPYDEEYKYTVSNGDVKASRKYVDAGGKRKTVTYATGGAGVRTHRPDADVARNDWRLKIENTDGTAKEFSLRSFSDVSFERESGNNWQKVASAMAMNNGGKDFSNAVMTNTNKHLKILEYGMYRKESAEGKEAHKGAKRYHGTHGGYSVQAPRGMIRLTATEFKDGEKAAREENRQIKADDIKFSGKIISERNKKDAVVKKALKEFKGSAFSETDILKALLKNQPTVDMNVKASEKLKEDAKKELERQFLKEEKEVMERLKKEEELYKNDLEEEAAATGPAGSYREWNSRKSHKRGASWIINTDIQEFTGNLVKWEDTNKLEAANVLSQAAEKGELNGLIDIRNETYSCKIKGGKIYLGDFGKDANMLFQTFLKKKNLVDVTEREFIQVLSSFDELA